MFYDERTDKFFSDLDDLKDEYDNRAFEDRIAEPEYPTWVYGCRKIPFALDIDNALVNEAEEMHEDFEISRHVIDLKELYDFIASWNKKQTAASYEDDYGTVVLLNE
jgi:hypothetical protein